MVNEVFCSKVVVVKGTATLELAILYLSSLHSKEINILDGTGDSVPGNPDTPTRES